MIKTKLFSDSNRVYCRLFKKGVKRGEAPLRNNIYMLARMEGLELDI